MSASPTLVLEVDDERTVVDRRLREERSLPASREARGNRRARRWWSALRGWGWPLSAAAFAVAVCASLLALANHQQRVHDRLLKTIEALQRDSQARTPDQATTGPPSVGTRSAEPPGLRPDVIDGQAVSREELELQAATLLIANDYEGALERYRRLSAQFSDASVFSDLVAILHSKLGCRSQRGATGPRCD